MAAHSSLYCTFPSLCVSLCVKILHQTEDSLQAKLISCSAAELFLVAGVSVFDPWKIRGSKAAHMLKELTLLYRHLRGGGEPKVLALRPALVQRPDAPCSPPHTANFHIVIQKVLCDWQTLIKRKTHDQERRVEPHTGREWMARNQFVYESYYTKNQYFSIKLFTEKEIFLQIRLCDIPNTCPLTIYTCCSLNWSNCILNSEWQYPGASRSGSLTRNECLHVTLSGDVTKESHLLATSLQKPRINSSTHFQS